MNTFCYFDKEFKAVLIPAFCISFTRPRPARRPLLAAGGALLLRRAADALLVVLAARRRLECPIAKHCEHYRKQKLQLMVPPALRVQSGLDRPFHYPAQHFLTPGFASRCPRSASKSTLTPPSHGLVKKSFCGLPSSMSSGQLLFCGRCLSAEVLPSLR